MTPAQISDAKMMIGLCWPVKKVARRFGLTETELRQELGMPVYERSKPQPKPWDMPRTLFDNQ